MAMKVVSVDAETDGLYGAVIAIGAVARLVYDGPAHSDDLGQFTGRIADLSVVQDEWVKEHVLPAIAHLPCYASGHELREAFWQWWLDQNKNGPVTCVAHMPHPVETGLFRACVEVDLPERQWQGPYPGIHDVATLLLAVHERPDSVDAYMDEHSMQRPEGSPHDPLYDATAAFDVWHRISDLLFWTNQ